MLRLVSDENFNGDILTLPISEFGLCSCRFLVHPL
jgi:hypothetical protein